MSAPSYSESHIWPGLTEGGQLNPKAVVGECLLCGMIPLLYVYYALCLAWVMKFA